MALWPLQPQSQKLQLPYPSLLPMFLQLSICRMSVCTMSPFWGWTGQKSSTLRVIDALKLETFKVLWISIPRLCVLEGALHKGGKTMGGQFMKEFQQFFCTALFE